MLLKKPLKNITFWWYFLDFANVACYGNVWVVIPLFELLLYVGLCRSITKFVALMQPPYSIVCRAVALFTCLLQYLHDYGLQCVCMTMDCNMFAWLYQCLHDYYNACMTISISTWPWMANQCLHDYYNACMAIAMFIGLLQCLHEMLFKLSNSRN